MERSLGEPVLLVPNSSGGLPSAIFGNRLSVPVLWIPYSYAGCRQHGPDEHAMRPILYEGLALMAGIFYDLGEPEARPV